MPFSPQDPRNSLPATSLSDRAIGPASESERLLAEAKQRTLAFLRKLDSNKPVPNRELESNWTRTPDFADSAGDCAAELFDAPVRGGARQAHSGDYAQDAPKLHRHSIPAARQFSPSRWVGHGETVQIADMAIPGLVYVGQRNGLNPHGGASLIDPDKRVAAYGDYTYWPDSRAPSYETMPDACRRAYLEWLVEGRTNARADLKYPTLFLMGLEHRVLIEGTTPEYAKDAVAIESELRSLLATYGGRSGTFDSGVEGLLERMVLMRQPEKLYEAFAAGQVAYSATSALARIALAQAAADKMPIASDLAFAWVSMQGDTIRRTPLQRCPQDVRAAFRKHFNKHYPAGLTLRQGRYPVEARYAPISFHLGSYGRTPQHVLDLRHPAHDSKVLLGLQGLVDLAQEELEPYSRFVGKYPELKGTMAAYTQAPLDCWPPLVRNRWDSLTDQVDAGSPVLTGYAELLSFLGLAGLPRECHKTVATSMQETFERWDIRLACSGDLRDMLPTKPVRVALSPLVGVSDYLEIPAVVAKSAFGLLCVAGHETEATRNKLAEHIRTWYRGDLRARECLGVIAELRVCDTTGVELAHVKRLISKSGATWSTWAVKALTQAIALQGQPSSNQVKALLKLCKAVGCEDDLVYGALHASVAQGGPRLPGLEPVQAATAGGVFLDESRIAALSEETAKADELLMDIFKEDKAPEPGPSLVLVQAQPLERSPTAQVLGLDSRHSQIATELGKRGRWSRAELAGLAKAQGLLLEGVLETLNDAAFEAIDAPFFDSEDPFELNPDILQHLSP